MPYIKVWIHFVWSTKNREPYLTKEIRTQIFRHIRENAQEKGIYIDFINGHIDHVHCLVSLGLNQNVAKVMQLIKGESAFWINQNNLCLAKFEWQDEYFAVSVSESMVNKVREYIKNQEAHHQLKSYQEEQEDFKRLYGF
ncbi:IS200/IS605 family transposase [Adhaeribacter swui]|uniref:IS200/IS605 family transposase n=1 Tax=Adhaeribacter swui TaxID=2086471 RepID=A0A7G7G9A1_9BACT|nr:IS200/IS605 family transposase [Adhaeribacter swui]QNF33735.1 IS200/IS605 family transposase [Adhaeribacter swui]